MMTETTYTPSAAYLAELEAFRVVANQYEATCIKYRAREIGDAEFLAARAALNAAKSRMDVAFAAEEARS